MEKVAAGGLKGKTSKSVIKDLIQFIVPKYKLIVAKYVQITHCKMTQKWTDKN